MSRIEIEAGGRRIVVDHDTELAHVAQTARDLWDHTAAGGGSAGPAFGFAHQQRWTPDVGDNNGGGSYRHLPFRPVTAQNGDSDE